MNQNILNIFIRPGVVLIIASAALVLGSTVIMAITNGGNVLVNGGSGVRQTVNQSSSNTNHVRPTSSNKTYRQRFSDVSVTAKVKSNLMWSAYKDDSSMNVDTQMGKVTLVGSTASVDARELAGWIARSTSGVVDVNNQVAVKPLSVAGVVSKK